jgi:hypothetical protein
VKAQEFVRKISKVEKRDEEGEAATNVNIAGS